MIVDNHRIYLRKLKASDAMFLYALMNQDSWIEYIGDRGIHNISAAEHYIQEGPITDYSRHGFGPYLVINKQSNQAVGMCGLLKRTYLTAPDLGFAISEEHTQKGYAFEASQLCIDYFKRKQFANKLLASTSTNNKASRALLCKLGFVEKGTLTLDEQDTQANNKIPILLYQLDM